MSKLKQSAPAGVFGLLAFALPQTGWDIDWLVWACIAIAVLWLALVMLGPIFIAAVAREVAKTLPEPEVSTTATSGRSSSQDSSAQRPAPPANTVSSSEQQMLLVTTARLLDDLEYVRGILGESHRDFFREGGQLGTNVWDAFEVNLSRAGRLDLHKIVRRAYRSIAEVGRASPWRSDNPGRTPENFEATLDQAARDVDDAISALERDSSSEV